MRVLFGVMATKAEGSAEGDAVPRPRRSGCARLLLVDDRPVARIGLAELLSERGGYSIVGESDGAPEVLNRVGELRPDAIVVDIIIRPGAAFQTTTRAPPER